MKLLFESEGIKNGMIADKYGAHGDEFIKDVPQISLPLKWSNVPEGTASFFISMIDYDNIEADEKVIWIHWLIGNIPTGITCLPEDASRNIKTISSSIVQGKNTFVTLYGDEEICNRYSGPGPLDKAHEYELKLYALKEPLKLKDGFTYNEFIKESRDKVLDFAVLCGNYDVKGGGL